MGDNRGGPRQGGVGGRFPNRSDLATPGPRITAGNVPTGQAYGQAAAQNRALQVQPTAGGASSTPAASGGGAPPAAIAPGSIPGLTDPTANPNEPVTAGLPVGPGVGPEALSIMRPDSPELAILHSLYLEYPNPDIRRFMAFLEDTLQF